MATSTQPSQPQAHAAGTAMASATRGAPTTMPKLMISGPVFRSGSISGLGC